MTNSSKNIPMIDGSQLVFENNNIINTLRSNGRSKHPEDINLLEIFLEKFNKQPKLFRFISEENGYYDWVKLRQKLSNYYKGFEIIYSDTYYDISNDKIMNKQETWILREDLIVHMEGGGPDDFYLIDSDIKDVDNLCSINLFLIGDGFKEKDDIVKIFKDCIIERTEVVSIGMVSWEDGSFYVKDFDVMKKTFELTLLDEHYGEGFQEFNDKLLNRLNSETKGLTLFHGKPGTGKTTYIRHLLRKLKEIDKENNILYFPPTMVDSITEPSFINFISEWVSDSKGKNYLLIEDAEPLLESRDQSRNIGITNLLNLTDGLLNDILSIQIIATFNTDLSNIDDALLRPERLIARKEFDKLSIEDAKILAEALEMKDIVIDKEMSLADFYSIKKESKTITHNIESKTNKIGFN